MRTWIDELKINNVGSILENEPLSKHTSWRVGGPVTAFIIPEDKDQLLRAISILEKNSIFWEVLGRGSNILVLDKGFDGAIISLERGFNNLYFDENNVNVGAGVSLIKLANFAAKHGLTGLEFCGGIPGTVGGAIYMNAGAHNSDISNVLVDAEVLLEDGQIINWGVEKFSFNYRTSILQEKKAIVLSANLKLHKGDRKKIASDMALFKQRRVLTQPHDLPCSGSVFRNPEGDYAGRLIEELGLKGYKIGGAEVSTKHANFIVNSGNATASDILNLIDDIKEKVYNEFNMALISEVEILGDNN